MKQVRKIQMHTVDADGTVSQKPTALLLDARGSEAYFVIEIPQYLQDAIGAPRRVHDLVQSKVVAQYEKLMREYGKWHAGANAVPVIVLSFRIASRDRSEGAREDISTSRFHYGSDTDARKVHEAEIDFSYFHAYRVNKRIFYRAPDPERPGSFKVGSASNFLTAGNEGEVVLDYTPELEAQLDRVCRALHEAAHVLYGIVKAKNIAEKILAIGGPGNGPALLTAPTAFKKPKGRKR